MSSANYTYPANFNGPSIMAGRPSSSVSVTSPTSASFAGLDAANVDMAKKLSPLAAEDGVKVMVTSASDERLSADGGVARKTSTTSPVLSHSQSH